MNGHVLVGRALERDQRVRRLRLVVERNQLELLAERAALRVDVVDDVLDLLQVGVADLRERPESGSVYATLIVPCA